MSSSLQSTAAAAAVSAPPVAWDTMYHNLVQFHQTRGHCRIRRSDRSLKNLYHWVSYQRCNNTALSQHQRAVLDELGFDWTTQEQKQEEHWNEMFESLKVYKAVNGDCLVPRSYCEDLALYKWGMRQRASNKTRKLPRHRRNRLRGIGFCWDASKSSNDTSQSKRRDPAPAQGTVLAPAAAGGWQTSWDVMFEKLARYYKNNGNYSVSELKSANLYDWIVEHRVANANNELSAVKRLKLDQIHFPWMGQDEKQEELWNEMFGSLKAYKAVNGDCLVPRSYCEDLKLYNWVSRQRSWNKKGKLLRHRRDRLRGIGFCWVASKASDDACQSQRRDPAPAQDIVPAPVAAGGQTSWDVMYKKLARYYRSQGNFHVSKSASADLYGWIVEQRVANANNELSADKRRKLDLIKFTWMGKGEKYEGVWNKMFDSLEAYKAANGDCLVTRSYCEDLKLFKWVKRQLHLNKTGKLPRRRWDRLQGIGFCWDVSLKPKETKQAPSLAVPEAQPNPSARDTTSDLLPSSNGQRPPEDARSLMLQKQWDEMFERLQAYGEVNGDSFALDADYRQLCKWVDKQRDMYRQRILLQHRREKLASIGFAWDARKPKISRPTEPRVTAVLTMKNHSVAVVSPRWNLQLERLKIYQAWYGDCLVPTNYDKELAEWVSWQHYLHKINKLREPRYGKLERIGFFSDAEAEKSWNGGTKRGASTRDALESEAQSIAGAQDLPDGTDNADAAKSGADLSCWPKRARVYGVTHSTGGPERD